MPFVSVVIPVRNGAAMLAAQIACVQAQAYDGDFEIVVADNGSTDEVPAVVRAAAEHDPRVRFVDASGRPGAAAARNVGCESARGELLLFCDADDECEPGWMHGLVSALLDADGAAGFFDYCRLHGWDNYDPSSPTPHQFQYLPAALGANLGVRASLFRELGGFDEEMIAGEDIDFCWRLQEAGGRFVLARTAVVAKRRKEGALARWRQAQAYGTYDPALFKRHKQFGMRRNFQLAIKVWTWMFLNLPLFWIPWRRNAIIHGTALRTGRIIGSFRYRVFYP